MKPDSDPTLTLSDAVSGGRLAEFVAQEEARGVGPASSDSLYVALARAARPRDQAEFWGDARSG